MGKNRVKIYQSRRHLFFALLTVAMPFLFLLLFAKIVGISAAKLLIDVLVSGWRLLAAYFIAVILAWIWGVTFFRGRKAEIALPLFDVLQSFPTFAALPLATFFLGVSGSTVILFLVLTIIWPIFFSIVSSLKLMKRDWEEAVEIAGLRGFSYFRYYLLPVSVPGLVTGSIIGLGEGWEAVVATEMIVQINNGLGSFFYFFSNNVLATSLGIMGLLMIIFSINKLFWFPLLEWSHKQMEE